MLLVSVVHRAKTQLPEPIGMLGFAGLTISEWCLFPFFPPLDYFEVHVSTSQSLVNLIQVMSGINVENLYLVKPAHCACWHSQVTPAFDILIVNTTDWQGIMQPYSH